MNINTAIRYDAAAQPNAELVDLTNEFKNRDNASFLAEVQQRLAALAEQPGPAGTTFDAGGAAAIGLIGEYGLIGYGIRRAQELIRTDRGPSYWSHAFLIYGGLSGDDADNRSAKRSAWIWESTLEPGTIANRFADRNGVGPRHIADYRHASFNLLREHSVPNMAVIALALTPEERGAILDRADDPDVDQLHYDLSGLLGTWFAYLTNRADAPNPLGAGHAVFCSAYVQLAYDAAGIDLAPGAHQRNTSPEHLWQAAKVLQHAFSVTENERRVPRRVAGWYCVRDRACVVAPVEVTLPRSVRDLIKEVEG